MFGPILVGSSVSPARHQLAAGSPAANAVLRVIARIEGRLRETRYQHRTVVRERRGLYAWDCSGMADWVLRRAAPKARRSLRRSRPVARDFFRAIDRAPSQKSRGGWQKLASIETVRPGDVFAWLRPPSWPRGITGHVGFVLERPQRVGRRTFVVRIADATSLPHEDDTRDESGKGGFGKGNLLFVLDPQGDVVIGYGWFGAESEAYVPTRVVFGRVTG